MSVYLSVNILPYLHTYRVKFLPPTPSSESTLSPSSVISTFPSLTPRSSSGGTITSVNTDGYCGGGYTKLIEKIRRWEYVDLSKLLGGSDPVPEEASMVVEGHILRMEIPQRGQKKQLSINDIFSWLKAYARFMAVMLSNSATLKEEAAGLAAHMHLILQLSGGSERPPMAEIRSRVPGMGCCERSKEMGQTQFGNIWQVFITSASSFRLRERKRPKRRQEILGSLL